MNPDLPDHWRTLYYANEQVYIYIYIIYIKQQILLWTYFVENSRQKFSVEIFISLFWLMSAMSQGILKSVQSFYWCSLKMSTFEQFGHCQRWENSFVSEFRICAVLMECFEWTSLS